MAQTYNPLIVTDGLKFCIDGANLKSYKGPVIQNLSNAISLVGTGTATGYSSAGSTELVNIPGLGETLVYTNTIQNNYTSFSPNSGNCCPALHSWGSFPVSPSTLYTYAIVYRVDSEYTHPNYMYRYEYTGSSGSYVTEAGVHTDSNRVSLGGGWYYAWNTFTTQATTNWIGGAHTFYYRYSQTADRLSVAKVLVAQGNYSGLHPRYWPNPATNRSTTQAFLDVTNNNTITVNSLTYNTSSFTFNGTSDFISGSTLSGSYSDFTVSAWFNPSVVANYRNVLDCNFNYNATTGNIGPRLEMNSSGNLVWILSGNVSTNSVYDVYNVISSGMQANRWYNVVITRRSGLISTYLNGEIVVSGATNSNGFVNVFNNVVIGKGFHLSAASERSFQGQISAVQIYNRGLSLGEVKQNYNAYRGRYNL